MSVAADDTDVPPLEDVSEVLQRVLQIKEKCSSSSLERTEPSRGQANVDKQDCGVQPICASENAISKTSKDDAFCGMKKGFLFGSTSVGKKQDKRESEIPHIKANKSALSEQHRFSEVQQAMQVDNAFSLNKDAWLTNGLLERIQSSPNLLNRLADPLFVNAISEFQTNPREALTKYRDNVAMQEFFKEFCGLFGDHLTSLDDSQPAAAATDTSAVRFHSPDGAADIVSRSEAEHRKRQVEEDARVKSILADSKLRETLLDTRIQRLMNALRTDPEEAQRMMRAGDSELKQKIGQLVRAGLLNFEP